MNETMYKKSTLSIALLAILLAGCKGGSGGSLGGDSGGDSGTTPNPGPNPNPTPTPVASKINIPNAITFSEPNNGSSTQYIEVTLSKALQSNLTLYLSTSDINARSSGQFQNYTAKVAEAFVIIAGQKTAQLPLIISNNNYYENDVSLTYSISAASSTDYLIENGQTTVTLSDTDGQPTVSFEKANRTLLEGDQDSFIVELSHYSHMDASVVLEQSGTVSSGDFVSDLNSDSLLTINSGTVSTSFNVTAQSDGLSEGAEALVYTLTQPTDTSISPNNSALSIYIPGDKRFNDTGYITKFNGTAFDETGSTPNYPNQDANYGLDIAAPVNHNDGQYGFSYSKFDGDGNSLPVDATDYTCIRDNATGLYIERKTSPSDETVNLPNQTELDEELDKQRDDPDNYAYPYSKESYYWQHTSYTYTWHEPEDDMNGGYQGAKEEDMRQEVPVDVTCAVSENSGSDRRCDSNGYLSQMNQFAVCGITDWRLPSPSEARSFVNYNVNNDELADNYFLTFIEGQSILTNATRPDKQGSAWCVNTETGQTKLCLKNKHYPIVAVSGGNH